MDLNINNITFIIVCFKSKKVIHNCIKSLPINCKKIIIENSKDLKLKETLEGNYDNIEVLINENLGMGASNNIGIKKSKTQFAFILNPDTVFRQDTFTNLVRTASKIEDFDILSPIHSKKDYPNYSTKKKSNNFQTNILEVDSVDGFSMLINKNNFKDQNYFDESFFLFLENDDLCLRTKKRNGNIYIIEDALIDHLGGSSSYQDMEKDIEYLRNWHWMWSKFYYNKKHYSYLKAFFKVSINFVSAIIKSLFYIFILNFHKSKIYQMRFLGLFNSLCGKKSFYRLKD
jgi:N-acetylglucosaminyl-diphospho-decaprenol L-rhamnosyltransferase